MIGGRLSWFLARTYVRRLLEDLASHGNKRQIKSKLKHKINKLRLEGFTVKNRKVLGL